MTTQRYTNQTVEITVQIAKGFNIKKEPKKAQVFLLKVEKLAKNNAMWHREMSLSFIGLNQVSLAEKYQEKRYPLRKNSNCLHGFFGNYSKIK